MQKKLTLQNGEIFVAEAFGHQTDKPVLAEIVFNTSMTGYQEIYTDPSYCDQMVVLTYPLIGNYGINQDDFENLVPHLKAVIVKEACESPSHFKTSNTLDEFLKAHKIPGLCKLDTRKLTKILRDNGAMKAVISNTEDDVAHLFSENFPTDQIKRVSTPKPMHYPGSGPRVVLIDFGFKKSILTSLLKRNCEVITVPFNTRFEDIQKFNPDGILLSNGPGDPKSVSEITNKTILKLQQTYPLFAICMGHQLFALANGLDTEKMKFGNRGGNHPVYDYALDKCFITSQNHGYAVKAFEKNESLLEVTQINLNDKSIEGLKHKELKAFSVQYHPEANPGPEDTAFLFDQFLENMGNVCQ